MTDKKPNSFYKDHLLEQMKWQETLQAIESVTQGRVIPGDAVGAWLQSWGKDNELSPPNPASESPM